MKSYLRASKASGSDKQKADRLIRLGWQPGMAYGEVLARKGRKQRRHALEGGHHDQ
jgi:hypothetical protein